MIIAGARPLRARRRGGCPAPRRRSARVAGRAHQLGQDGRACHDRRRALGHEPAHPSAARRAGATASRSRSASTVDRASMWPSTSSGTSRSRPRSIVASVVMVPATPTSVRAAVVSASGRMLCDRAPERLRAHRPTAGRCAGSAPTSARSRCRGWSRRRRRPGRRARARSSRRRCRTRACPARRRAAT